MREQPVATLPELLKHLPLEVVREALIEFGRESKRTRKLPDFLVVFLTVGLGLFRDLSMSDVLRRVAGAVGARICWGLGEAPHPTSITKARDRLGWEVMRRIFQKLAECLDSQFSGDRTWRGLIVRALDGSTARVADTRVNDAWFGRPARTGGGTSAFPQLRTVLVFDVSTRLVSDAVFGPYTTSEVRLAEHLIDRQAAGTLLLLDRAYHSFTWPARVHARGCYFLIRMKLGVNLVKAKPGRWLGRGDRLNTLVASRPARKRFPLLATELRVRVITVRRKGFRPIMLMTNLLSKVKYPTAELAKLYGLRWEAEVGYREIKAGLVGEHVTFRSHRPERVLQEAYGLLIAFNCARALMCEAAKERGIPPLSLSFVKSLELIRLTFRRCSCRHLDLSLAIGLCVLQPKRVGRRCPREVKARPNKYSIKRRGRPPAVGRYAWRAKKRAEVAEAAQATEFAS